MAATRQIELRTRKQKVEQAGGMAKDKTLWDEVACHAIVGLLSLHALDHGTQHISAKAAKIADEFIELRKRRFG